MIIATNQFTISIINDGQDGVGIVENIIEYCISSSGTIVPGSPLKDGDGNIIYDVNGLILTDGNWSTTLSASSDGDYIWTRSKTVYSNGTFALAYMVAHHGEKGSTGAQGVSVVNVIPEYRLSDSSSELTGNGAGYSWSETKPKVESGQYIWERQRNELSNNTVVYSDAVCDVTMSGVVFDVDQNKKAISSKVWQSDLTTAINQYDSTKAQSIRDRVTATEQDINGITSTVSDVQSTLSTKADGQALTTLQNTVSQNEQTASQFRQTVQSTYARLTDVDSKISDIKISGHNLYVMKNDVPGYINSSGGTIATQSSTYKERTSEYIPVKEGETYVVQSWVTPNAAGQSWLAYQFYTNNTGTPSGGRTAKYGGDSGSGVETTADGQEHLTYKFTIPSGVNYLRVSYRQFSDGYAMIEKANTASEYAMNPEDLEKYTDDAVSTAKSEIKQTTDSISLEVSKKVGASEIISKINQTPETITIDASKVDLVGKVTFSMLDSAAQKKVNDAQSTADNAVSKAEVADEKAAVGLGMKVNYSTFSLVDPGECYLHGYTNDVAADVDGYVYWNGIKRTVPKKMLNPNDVLPYLQTIYIVLRLSSANAMTGTLYMVYYNNGWKYAVTPTPTAATTGDWTWTENVDIVLGQFMESSNEGQVVDAYLYDPPRNASHVITTGQNPYKYSQAAVNWVNTNGSSVVTAKDIINNWATDATTTNTTIRGGLIETHTILAKHLASDAIMSNNYIEGPTNSPYSSAGTFLDLSDGNIYMPNFGVNAITGAAYFNGTITAVDGMIGSDSTNYWQLGTITDYNGNDSAALVGHGTSYIQSGKWMISEDRIDTRWYDANRKYMYILNGTTYWDYGMQVPDPTSNLEYEKNFLYIRKHANTIPTLESDWDYPFRVTSDGKIYATDIIITGGGSGSTYLPLAGGTITGNLTVNGTLTATASQANKVTHSLSVNGKSFDGSANVTVGTIGAAYGGTGQTSLVNSANALINALTIGSSTPVDADYYVSQYVDGGSSHTTFHRRPMSALWTYIKGKIDAVYDHSSYRTLDNNDFDTANITDANVGNLVVTGAARFTNGLYGNLTGTASEATHAVSADNATNATNATSASTASKVANSLKIQLNGGTTEGTNQFTFDGSAAKNINITKSSIGLGNVENTALSSWAGSANLTTTKVGTLAAAATKGVDTSVASNSTSTNVPTSKAVATLVTGYAVKGLSSGTTSGHFVTWGANGYTVADSGYSAGQAVSSLASNNDGKLVLTYLDGTTSDPIEVKIIGSSGSSVSYADALNVNGTAVGSATQPVYIDNQGKPQTANKIPKLNNANSDSAFYAPTTAGASGYYLKSSGSGAPIWAEFSKSTVGLGNVDNTADANKNVLTATKFATAQSVTLTGDTVGTASSQAGWSITTKTDRLSTVGDKRAAETTPNDYNDKIIFQGLKQKAIIGNPSNDMYSYLVGLRGWRDSSGGNAHEIAFNNSGIYRRTGATTEWGNWYLMLDSNNFNSYAPDLDGTGATGTWGIGISGNAATATKATQDGNGSVISSTYAKLSGATFTGAVSGTSFAASDYITVNSGNSGTAGGLALHGTIPTNYGIAMRSTSNSGKHGYVQGDWATYFFMCTTAEWADTRGWIFKHQTANAGVASISTNGNATFSGSVTVGGNVANDAGCRMVMNTSTSSLDFIFN